MFVKIIGIFAKFERENSEKRVTFGYEQKTKEYNYTNCNNVFRNNLENIDIKTIDFYLE